MRIKLTRPWKHFPKGKVLELPGGVADYLKVSQRAVDYKPPQESEPECMVPQRTVHVTASKGRGRRGKGKPLPVEV